MAATDVVASLDAAQALCPNLRRVSLVVTWFGDDLRAGHCTVAPRVEIADKPTRRRGLVGRRARPRPTARVVSQVDGRAGLWRHAVGRRASSALIRRPARRRGLAVTLYPFVMMDIPAGNALPDPWTGAAGQPRLSLARPHHLRSRRRAGPAAPTGRRRRDAGRGLLRHASAGRHFVADGAIACSGPDEWSYRRLVLHYAQLAAGGRRRRRLHHRLRSASA